MTCNDRERDDRTEHFGDFADNMSDFYKHVQTELSDILEKGLKWLGRAEMVGDFFSDVSWYNAGKN